MSSDVQIFENGDLGKVRVVMRNGEPWFVAKDIANILGYADATHATRLLEEDEKGLHIVETLGGKQELTIIPESGVYQLIFQSRKPEAKAFSKWVRSEVLPTIRKTGSYGVVSREIQPNSMSDFLEGAKVILNSAGVIGNQQTLALDKIYRKHSGYSALEVCGINLIAPTPDRLLTPTQIGQQFKRKDGKPYTAQQINNVLVQAGFQYKHPADQGWLPTQKGLKAGAVIIDVQKANGKSSTRQLKWPSAFLDTVKELVNTVKAA